MKALIDADIVAFRCAASANTESFEVARYYMEQLLDVIMETTKADEMFLALSGDNNFRKQIYPEYKANRIDMEKPQFLAQCKDYLHLQYNAVYSDGCEADDLLGIEQCKDINNTIICSLDKDLRQIPGWHFSWEISGGKPEKRWTKPAELVNVTHDEGTRFFYKQLIIGDATDNIKGVRGAGKKAAEIIDALSTEQEMFETVRDMYGNDDEMLMNGQCLYIWKKENDIWRFPTFETSKQ